MARAVREFSARPLVHTGLSDAVDVIKSQPWDYVVLQQGPTTLSINRDTLIIATKLLDPIAHASGGRTSQLMAWPDAESPQLFPAIRASSQAAAQSVGGLFIPAGDAWRAALEADPTILLYGFDRYHPARLGTYLAALVVYERVTGKDARQLPAAANVAGPRLVASEQTVRFLQQIAHDTVLRYPRDEVHDVPSKHLCQPIGRCPEKNRSVVALKKTDRSLP